MSSTNGTVKKNGTLTMNGKNHLSAANGHGDCNGKKVMCVVCVKLRYNFYEMGFYVHSAL